MATNQYARILLAVLFKRAFPMSMREISEVAMVSPITVKKHLHELKKMKIVKTIKKGKRDLWTINWDNFLKFVKARPDLFEYIENKESFEIRVRSMKERK